MTLFLSSIIILSTCMMVVHAGSPVFPDDSLKITLERGMCFGTCPVYSVSLYGNGTITWDGKMYVEKPGNSTDLVEPTIISDVLQQLEINGFFSLNDEYTAFNITDMPSAILTVENKTIKKQVRHYYGDTSAPRNLIKMEDLVDTAANTTRWIGNSTSFTMEEGEFL